MSTLHTINKSPFTHTTLISCMIVCTKNDGILLLEDGVFGAMADAPCAEKLLELMARDIKIYALRDDVKARGLSEKLLANIHLTDYDGFVHLSMKHQRVQSWY